MNILRKKSKELKSSSGSIHMVETVIMDLKLLQNNEKTVDFDQICQIEKETRGTFSGFLGALSVYINKPHVVNRRLVGSVLTYAESINNVAIIDEKCQELTEIFSDQKEITSLKTTVNLNQQDKVYVVVRDLIPKQLDKYPTLRELVCFDFEKQTVRFQPICCINVIDSYEEIDKNIDDEMIYTFTFQTDRIRLEVYKKTGSAKDGHLTLFWLTDVLLIKLCHWAEEKSLRIGQTSLKLLAVDEYNKLYNELKQKYGVKLVEVWPERTDPQKFVYEDIAIATYLLLLWRGESGENKKQTFVDLGCGNGLLVYILTAEGHTGVGLDLRKRQIWDWYGSGINLKVESITPSSDTLFPNYDWLIGNHSDELTPWIPVMAARSSYKCKYFVLPCCHFDFNCKFNQRDTGTSQYQTYLNFVQQVGEISGFNVEDDTLRIPSTKRVCFVGRTRNYKESEESLVDIKRMEYINKRCIIATAKNSLEGDTGGDSNIQTSMEGANKKIRLDEGGTPWVQSFQPRSAKEIPRNCQSVPNDIKTLIVKTVFKYLIESTDSLIIQTEHGTSWNKGGTLPLSNVAELFASETLRKLKSECGGLQTLLRNHNHIFQVTGGIVRLRDLSSEDPFGKKHSKKKKASKSNSEDFIKTTLCWFNEHHPDGCPQTAVNCKYAHGAQELKLKPSQLRS